jgi:hypothetical protein
MNKFINVVLIFVLFPTMLLTILIGFDISIDVFKIRTTGAALPFRFEILLGLGLFILIVNVRRSVRRWMGMRLVNQIEKFKWNQPMSDERIKRVRTYNFLEGFVMLFVAVTLYVVSPEAWMPAIGFAFCTLDNLIFTLVGIRGKRFRAGITSKAVITADREVNLVYFAGLRKVTIHQQSMFFDYIKELQLSFPVDSIQEEQRDEFFDVLEGLLDRDKVFITKNR